MPRAPLRRTAANLECAPGLERWHRAIFLFFLLAWALNFAAAWVPLGSATASHWADGILLFAALLTTLVALARELPGQNVLAAAGLIFLLVAGLGAAAGAVSPSSLPSYSETSGIRILHGVPWFLPVAWIVMLLNARGVARLLLRPWRRVGTYGFWRIGVSGLLVVLLDLGLEPYAVRVKGLWQWPAPHAALNWYTAPWLNFLVWLLAAVAIQLCVLPWLIRKKPGQPPVEFHSLAVWLLLSVWLAAGNAAHQLWAAALAGLACSLGVGVFAGYAVCASKKQPEEATLSGCGKFQG